MSERCEQRQQDRCSRAERVKAWPASKTLDVAKVQSRDDLGEAHVWPWNGALERDELTVAHEMIGVRSITEHRPETDGNPIDVCLRCQSAGCTRGVEVDCMQAGEDQRGA